MPDMSVLDDILLEISQADYRSPRRLVSPKFRPDQLNTDRSNVHHTFPRRLRPAESQPLVFTLVDREPRTDNPEKLEELNGNLAVSCPFGTYLDLHFVDFCNSLSWSKRVPDSIKRFRQAASNRKNKWRKSMDQLLYADINLKEDKTLFAGEKSTADGKCPANFSQNVTESSPLHEALSHFDEALKSHFAKKSTRLQMCCEEEDVPEKCVYSLPEKYELRESLFTVPNPRLPKRSPEVFTFAESSAPNGRKELEYIEKEKDRADSITSSSPSSVPATRMVPAEALESIREKLAAGLEQMKSLQDQVDTLPNLHNQISALQKELFLRDEQDSLPGNNSTDALAFIQLYVPNLLETYLGWMGKREINGELAPPKWLPTIPETVYVGRSGNYCEKATQIGRQMETADIGIATTAPELVSFGINTDSKESVTTSTMINKKRLCQRIRVAGKVTRAVFHQKKQQFGKNRAKQFTDQLHVAVNNEETSWRSPDKSLGHVTEEDREPKSEGERIGNHDASVPDLDQAPFPPPLSESLSDSIPESGVILSQQTSDTEQPAQASNHDSTSPSTLSSSHSENQEEEEPNSCCSDDADEGSYDLQHGHLSHKCFDENACQPEKHVYTNYICRQSLNREMMAACKVLNDSLQREGIHKSKKSAKNVSSLAVIQREWFPVTGKEAMDAHLVSDYLDGFEAISKLLLQAVVNLTDENGNTLLHYALSQNNFDVVSLLLDSKVCSVDIVNRAGYTSVMLASLAELTCASHYAIAGRLFRLGDINRKAQQHGQTALMLAVSHGRLDTVRMLLEVGADVNIQDNDGSTALMCASEHGHIDIVQLLLNHPDVDTSLIDQDGIAALYVALEAGNKDIAALIYAKTASTKLSTMSMSEKVSNGSHRRRDPSLTNKTATM